MACTCRYTRSEEDLTQVGIHSADGDSPKPNELASNGSSAFIEDPDCWSQEDDEILQVPFSDVTHNKFYLYA